LKKTIIHEKEEVIGGGGRGEKFGGRFEAYFSTGGPLQEGNWVFHASCERPGSVGGIGDGVSIAGGLYLDFPYIQGPGRLGDMGKKGEVVGYAMGNLSHLLKWCRSSGHSQGQWSGKKHRGDFHN